ncbi:PIG-L deacetylase family protein [Actinocrispum wychmicini]|uniref:LmbE family N-acetylglucosaminyl deacetylase n=1 Tax=Actinocrispum wychmicini TaxID=1213861 RepID=A0A4R2JIK7_9PSEU|nr:PIG-L deacetylase family protein [Actinocrispum wychmicini]TCO56846.1 LmbE family N-acetylglucosaminyl deacetylase [Actinocrispum wychmicini]
MADLEPLPSDWERALGVVAHPDDLEYGASAAVAEWTSAGKSVAYVLATRGEAGIDSVPPEKCGPLREREQIEAASIVGVSAVEFLDHMDGVIEHSPRLRRDLAGAIRRHRPELIVTLNFEDTWGGGYRNSPDHRNLGLALVDAVGDAGNRWIFRDLGLEPWNGVRWVAVCGASGPTHAAGVSPSSLDRGVKSLQAHRAYLDGLGGGPMTDADAIIRDNAVKNGERFGGQPAVTFELIPFT